MASSSKNISIIKNQPLALKRRQLLRAGVSGAVVAMVAIGTPCLAAAPKLTHDFGPRYTVQDVYKIGRHTHVELGFQFKNRSFSLQLRSLDQKVWRTV